MMSEYIQELVNDIDNQKLEVLKARLKLLGISIDWELEKTRKFKSITLESHPNRDIYYYNDGSENGIKIVTFEESPHNIDFKDDKFSLGLSYKYY